MEGILKLILSCLYFFLPALISNMMASVTRHFSFLKFFEKPIDFGKKINGNFILGPSKTWRGLIFGPLFGFLVVILQFSLYYKNSFFKEISLIDFSKINIFIFWFLMCFGAILGDALFSFFKRRLNIAPGKPWIPFDQLDFVIGSFLFLTPYLNFYLKLNIGLVHWGLILIISFLLHVITNNIGYYTGLQKNRW
jgi:hypothetical protein